MAIREYYESFNINDYIKVKLTDKGREIVQDDYDRMCALYPSADFKPIHLEDDGGYTKFQLWDFMRLFGRHFCLGSPQYIEHNEILFCDTLPEPRAIKENKE